MADLTFANYSEHAKSTAYFLDDPDSAARKNTVEHGFREEVNELLTDKQHPDELVDMLWGKPIDPDIYSKLRTDKISEAGDILFYIAAAGILANIPLQTIGAKAAELYSGRPVLGCTTFAELDDLVHGKIAPQVPETYKPNYVGMQFWNLSPFEGNKDPSPFKSHGQEADKKPLALKPDGLYTIERLSRSCGDFMTYGGTDLLVHETSLFLGGISIILQHRFGGSLAEAAQVNIEKRERRALANTLAGGEDPERSRPKGKERPKLNGWDSTQLNLLCNVSADEL